MRVVLVEDDFEQAEQLAAWLTELPGMKAEVDSVATESDFIARIPDFVARKPGLFVIDVMLRWTDPAPEMTDPPEDVAREGFYRAGFRCVRRILENRALRDVPIVIVTMLDGEDVRAEMSGLPEHVRFVSKEEGQEGLFNSIRAVREGSHGRRRD